MASPVFDFDEEETALDALERQLQRRRWLRDPIAWVRERTGGYLWSAQRRILESLRDHRRTAVASCHGPGKSYTSANRALGRPSCGSSAFPSNATLMSWPPPR